MNSVFSNPEDSGNQAIIETIAKSINDLYYRIKYQLSDTMSTADALLKCIEIYDQKKFSFKPGEREMFSEQELNTNFQKDHPLSKYERAKDVNFDFCCFAYQHDFDNGKYREVDFYIFRGIISKTLARLNGPEKERQNAIQMVFDAEYKGNLMPQSYVELFKKEYPQTIQSAKDFISSWHSERDSYGDNPPSDVIDAEDLGGMHFVPMTKEKNKPGRKEAPNFPH